MLIKCLPVGHLMTNCYIVTDETTLECAVIDPGDESNTILYYLEDNHLTCRAILLTHGHYDHTGAVGELQAKWPETPVYLKVVVEKLTRTFYYSYDGQKWEKVGALENCIYLCDEGVPDDPKRHTGTLVGIYANNGGCGSRKAADFDYFKYED